MFDISPALDLSVTKLFWPIDLLAESRIKSDWCVCVPRTGRIFSINVVKATVAQLLVCLVYLQTVSLCASLSATAAASHSFSLISSLSRGHQRIFTEMTHEREERKLFCLLTSTDTLPLDVQNTDQIFLFLFTDFAGTCCVTLNLWFAILACLCVAARCITHSVIVLCTEHGVTGKSLKIFSGHFL